MIEENVPQQLIPKNCNNLKYEENDKYEEIGRSVDWIDWISHSEVSVLKCNRSIAKEHWRNNRGLQLCWQNLCPNYPKSEISRSRLLTSRRGLFRFVSLVFCFGYLSAPPRTHVATSSRRILNPTAQRKRHIKKEKQQKRMKLAWECSVLTSIGKGFGSRCHDRGTPQRLDGPLISNIYTYMETHTYTGCPNSLAQYFKLSINEPISG